MTAGGPGSDLDGRLRAAGLRCTEQRRAVLRAIDDLRHATVDELAARVQETVPEVSLSTVYRILETFDDAGLVTHAHLHHGSPTWHSVDDHPHLHLVCSGCGGVEQQPVDIAAAMADRALEALGFRVDLGHLVLHGRCGTCVAGSVAGDAVLESS